MDPGSLISEGTVLAERFRIERRIAAGALATVFRARDLQRGVRVAVKILYGREEGEHRQRLFREASILERVRHPGIVRYVAHGIAEHGHPYLAMDWIHGETLAKRLAQVGLTMGESVRMVTRIAEILAVAHASGIVHRDIKPGNLILRDHDVADPALIDFGIARIGSAPSAITLPGVMLGTLGYMAPEQARGTKQLDARADVFALGAVLFKCLTGHPAFAGDDEIAILAKMLFEPPPRARDLRMDLPLALDELLGRMLARDPLERPADAGIVAAELAAFAGIDGSAALPAREASAYSDVLTRGEQRLVSVVVVAARDDDDGEEPTIVDPSRRGLQSLTNDLRAAIQPFGAQLESLATGTIVVTLPDQHSATDRATRAARCVLAMRSAAPTVPLVLATGRAVLGERGASGDAVDRAIVILELHRAADEALAAERKAPPIHVDEITAGLLDARFSVKEGAAGLELTGEEAAADASRMLLGKPTPCVGRERELVLLDGVFAECVADDVARVVLVTAPAGVGKSRLRYELLRAIAHRGTKHEVWSSRGDPIRAGSPFGMLAQILRSAAEVQEGEPARVQREKVRARVARHVPQVDVLRVTQFLGETLGISLPEDDDVQLRAARHDPVLMGDQMRRAFEDWLGAECAAQPVLLVLEDLQWGDLPSVKFVDSALRTLHERALMVLALARPEVSDVFPKLFADRGLTELHLKELSRKASEKLVRQVLGDDVGDDHVARIVDTAGGNAFFLEELIRAHSSAGPAPIAASHGDGPPSRRSLAPNALPETVLTMVQARLEALEPEARRVLRAASIFGQTFWQNGVVALLHGENARALVASWLDELTVREIITRREQTKFKGEVEYRFRHAFVAEAAYAMLTDRDRTLGHKVAAAWLETVGESEAVVLAEHLERGGERSRAIGFYRRAAAQALEGNDLAACLTRADAGIACGADGELLGRLLLRKSEAHRWRGEHEKSKACAQQALELLPRTGRRWFRAAGETVEACARLGEESELHRAVDALCEVSAAGPLTPPHLVALTRAAYVLMAAGNYPSADDLLRTVDAAYDKGRRKEDDPLASAHVERARAYRAHVSGDAGSALSGYQIAIEHFRAAGDMRAACRHLVSAAGAWIEVGAYAEAERALAEASGSASQMGLSAVAASIDHHASMLRARLGDVTGARAKSAAALDAFIAQRDRRMEAAARLYRGYILALAGDLAGAEREVERVLAQASTTPQLRAQGLALLANSDLGRGRIANAQARAQEALELLDSLGGVEEAESYIRLAHAETLLAQDDPGAREAITKARARLLERAATIRDEAWKTAFLEVVPENARTLELARDLTSRR